MIGNRAQRLIGRALVTAAVVGAMIVLILIYNRSGGTGASVGPVTPGADAAGSGGAGRTSATSGAPQGGGAPAPGGNASAQPAGPAAPTHTYMGPVVQILYGPVQVEVAAQGRHVTDVMAVQLPTDRPQSLFISQQAAPLLRQEALQAQSARINIVSGATFTSEGFAQSLQQALSHIH